MPEQVLDSGPEFQDTSTGFFESLLFARLFQGSSLKVELPRNADHIANKVCPGASNRELF